jgi:hypothetical protein
MIKHNRNCIDKLWCAAFWVWLTAFRHLLFHCEVVIVDIVNSVQWYTMMWFVFPFNVHNSDPGR